MTKKELINRWKTPTGEALVKNILNSLNKKTGLDGVSDLATFEGRWDLRGAQLSTIISERKIGTKDHSLNQKFGSLKCKRTKFENVDFSFSDISYGMFQECEFDNCVFNEVKAKEINIYASNFNNCKFFKSNFSYSFMNMNIGSDAGSYQNCEFLSVNLRETIFSFPVIDNCVFRDCDLYATNFDGSRMRNVIFKGFVSSPFIKGYSKSAQKSILWIFNRVDPKLYPNKMENVDFTDALLDDVLFSDGVDISNCKFSESCEFILIKNTHQVFTKIRNIIENQWSGEDKRQGLFLIDNLYYDKKKHSMTMDLISTIPSKHLSKEFQCKLFNLIREANDS